MRSAAGVLRGQLVRPGGLHRGRAAGIAERLMGVKLGAAQEEALGVWGEVYGKTSGTLHGAAAEEGRAARLYAEVLAAARELLVPLPGRAPRVLELTALEVPGPQEALELARWADPRATAFFFRSRPAPAWLPVLQEHAPHLLLPDGPANGTWPAAVFFEHLAGTDPQAAGEWLAAHAVPVAGTGGRRWTRCCAWPAAAFSPRPWCAPCCPGRPLPRRESWRLMHRVSPEPVWDDTLDVALWNSSMVIGDWSGMYDHIDEVRQGGFADLLRRHGVAAMLCAKCEKPITAWYLRRVRRRLLTGFPVRRFGDRNLSGAQELIADPVAAAQHGGAGRLLDRVRQFVGDGLVPGGVEGFSRHSDGLQPEAGEMVLQDVGDRLQAAGHFAVLSGPVDGIQDGKQPGQDVGHRDLPDRQAIALHPLVVVVVLGLQSLKVGRALGELRLQFGRLAALCRASLCSENGALLPATGLPFGRRLVGFPRLECDRVDAPVVPDHDRWRLLWRSRLVRPVHRSPPSVLSSSTISASTTSSSSLPCPAWGAESASLPAPGAWA